MSRSLSGLSRPRADRAPAPVVLPRHGQAHIGEPKHFLPEVIEERAGTAVAQVHAPEFRDLLQADPCNPGQGMAQAGDPGHEDQEDIGRFHGQAGDDLTKLPRIDEIHSRRGNVVRVEKRLEVGRALEEKRNTPVARLVTVIGAPEGIRLPSRFRPPRVNGAERRHDDGIRRDGELPVRKTPALALFRLQRPVHGDDPPRVWLKISLST